MNDLTPLQWAVLPLKKYASFSGRASRAEYWWFYLMTVVLGFVTAILDSVLGLSPKFGDTGPINGAVSLAFLLPTLAALVRRLHDTNRSGWWLGGPLIVLVGLGIFAVLSAGNAARSGPVLIAVGILAIGWAIAVFVFSVSRGTEGPNDYGPDPYGLTDYEHVFA